MDTDVRRKTSRGFRYGGYIDTLARHILKDHLFEQIRRDHSGYFSAALAANNGLSGPHQLVEDMGRDHHASASHARQGDWRGPC